MSEVEQYAKGMFPGIHEPVRSHMVSAWASDIESKLHVSLLRRVADAATEHVWRRSEPTYDALVRALADLQRAEQRAAREIARAQEERR